MPHTRAPTLPRTWSMNPTKVVARASATLIGTKLGGGRWTSLCSPWLGSASWMVVSSSAISCLLDRVEVDGGPYERHPDQRHHHDEHRNPGAHVLAGQLLVHLPFPPLWSAGHAVYGHDREEQRQVQHRIVEDPPRGACGRIADCGHGGAQEDGIEDPGADQVDVSEGMHEHRHDRHQYQDHRVEQDLAPRLALADDHGQHRHRRARVVAPHEQSQRPEVWWRP